LEIAMRLLYGALSVALLLTGCSSTDGSSDDTRGWERQIRFIEPEMIGERRYEELAGLEEDATITESGEEIAIDRAKDRMRQRAAKIDADAVVMLGCERESDAAQAAIRAGEVIRCRGVAIRWKTP
jgi:hypothetical protein